MATKRSRVKGYVAVRPDQVPGDLTHPARQAEMAAAMAVQGERPTERELDTTAPEGEKRRKMKRKPSKAKPKTAAVKRRSPARRTSGTSAMPRLASPADSKRLPGQPPKTSRR